MLIGAGLMALYPQHQLLERILQARREDPLTIEYLINLHRESPGDAQIALLLAEARLALGQTDEALRLTAALLNSTDLSLRRRAMLAHIAALPDSKAKAAFIGPRLQERWSQEDLLKFAGYARGAGDAQLRGAVFRRLAASQRDPEWFARSARDLLGDGDYRLAAQFWFTARSLAASREKAKDYYLEGVRTLQSGNLLDEAIAAAEAQLGDLAGDEETILAIVQLALASGRPDIAQRWMKRLLWPGRAVSGALPFSVLRSLASWLIASAHAQAPPKGMRAYDERIYTFAYEVFLANGNVEDAFRVAQSAVAQRPADLVWRERLAEAAEWSRHPDVALEQWLFLAQSGAKDNAWQGVLRLAPGLGEDEALLAATLHFADRKDSKPSLLDDLAALFERVGRPRDGVAWFEARYAKRGQIRALELAADLADRAGERDQAIELNRKIIAIAGANEARLVRTAALLVLAGQFRPAHELLATNRAKVGPEAAEYWDLLGDLAWWLQDDESAIHAYRALSSRKEAEAGDFDRLVTLMRARHPQEAAKIAEAGFQRFRTPGLMLTALEIYWESRDLGAMKRLYAGIDAEAERKFDRIAFFYSLRAQYRQAGGDLQGARADLSRAIEILPGDAGLRIALTWLLIDLKDPKALRIQLEDLAKTAADTRDLWSLQAAGWTTLGEPRRALPFHERLARDRPQDYLGLMAYADALEQSGQAGASARVRRHAWIVVRKAYAEESARGDRQLRETLARLAQTFAGPDAGLAVIRDLMRRDFAPGLAPDETNRSAAMRELVLAWALSTEQYSNAKIWMLQQYGRKLAAPGWAAVAVALGENDAEAAERLLAERGPELPAASRIEAARLSGQLRLAQTLAFEEQTRRPEDDYVHLQLADTLLAGANRLVGGALSSRRGVLDSRPREVQTQVWVTPSLRLAVHWREATQGSNDERVLIGVPRNDRETKATLRQVLDSGWVEAAVGERSSFAEQTSLRASLFTQWSLRLSTLLTAGHNERTLDSTALAVAGSKSELAGRFAYAFAKSEYVAGALRGARYQTQNGVHLGSGKAMEWELGHRVRLEYPDLSVRLTSANYSFSAAGNDDAQTARLNPLGGTPGAAFFIPQNSRVLGAGISLGDSVREGYSRAVRPFGSFARTSSSLAGSGYNASLGAGGSLFGADQLSFYWNRSRGGGSSGASTLEYGLRYEYLFDRF